MLKWRLLAKDYMPIVVALAVWGFALGAVLFARVVADRTIDDVQRAIMNSEYLHDTVAIVPGHEEGKPHSICVWLWHKGKKIKDNCP